MLPDNIEKQKGQNHVAIPSEWQIAATWARLNNMPVWIEQTWDSAAYNPVSSVIVITATRWFTHRSFSSLLAANLWQGYSSKAATTAMYSEARWMRNLGADEHKHEAVTGNSATDLWWGRITREFKFNTSKWLPTISELSPVEQVKLVLEPDIKFEFSREKAPWKPIGVAFPLRYAIYNKIEGNKNGNLVHK